MNTVTSPTPSGVAVPRPAATIIVVRDAPQGLEVLLMQRAEARDHNSGAWVFPGGLLEASDRHGHPLCHGLDDEAASARLGVPEGGLDYYVAAMRECFEEAGLLFGVADDGCIVQMQGEAGARLAAQRKPLHRREAEFAAICRDSGLRLAADRLSYVAHWVTPVGRAKRFDTRFFVAALPEGQASLHDAVELLDHVWVRPASALAPENTRRLMTPTRVMLQTMSRFDNTEALLAWARSLREVRKVMPRLGYDSTGLRPVAPHEPAYAELGRIEMLGQGNGWCEIRPGVPVRLSPRLLRVSSGGAVTRNSYLVGGGEQWAVIDPGPADERHVEALVAAAPGRIRWIFSTDASGAEGAALLQARTGAQPAGEPAHGATIALASAATLQVIGAGEQGPDRRYYLLLEESTLFTGSKPDEMPTLGSLLAEPLKWLAPSEGFLVACT